MDCDIRPHQARRTLSPFRVQKFLAGIRYPARKRDVLARAGKRGADAEVLRALESIEDREYASPVALAREIRY
jgi:hypothetical protein